MLIRFRKRETHWEDDHVMEGSSKWKLRCTNMTKTTTTTTANSRNKKNIQKKLRRTQISDHNWNDKAIGLSPFLELTHHQKERKLEEYICTLGCSPCLSNRGKWKLVLARDSLLKMSAFWWRLLEDSVSIETIWFLIHVESFLEKKNNSEYVLPIVDSFRSINHERI